MRFIIYYGVILLSCSHAALLMPTKQDGDGSFEAVDMKKGLLYLRLTKSPFSTCKKSRTFLYIPQIHTVTYQSVHIGMGNLCIWKTMTFTKRNAAEKGLGCTSTYRIPVHLSMGENV